MVGIKDFGVPSCCMNCEMFDGEYGNCDIIGDTQDFEYQWNENRPFDCPLIEAIPKDEVIALFTELQQEIKKLDLEDAVPEYQDGAENTRDYIDNMIEEKIDKLKGE